MNSEQIRLEEAREQNILWKKWGPYLSERQWGTVREDYSEGGDAWNFFTHDQARSRAYRWGEDGISCPRSGSETTGRRGLPNPTGRPRNPTSGRSRRRRARARSRRLIRHWVNSSFPVKARCRCSSPRTKPTTNDFSSGRRTRAPTSRTASTTMWSRGDRAL